MGFFSKLFGTKDTAPIDVPARVEVVPGQLSVNVFSHSIANVAGAFWSFVTDGLIAHGQPELVVTLLRRKDEPEVPRALLSFFAKVHELAQQGQYVRAGEWTELGQAGFLGPEIRGMGYAAARPIESVELPREALAGILLSSVEIEIAKAYGLYRVLARLGQASRAYPFPFWCDRDRANRVAAGADSASMLDKVARIRTRGISLVAEDNTLKMRVVASAAKELEQAFDQLPPDVGFAFLTEPAEDADGWLVWVPGQGEAAAITPEGSTGSRLTGYHLVLAPNVDEDRVLMGEDGFFMLMRAESWQRFKQALQRQERFDMTSDNMGFELRWLATKPRQEVRLLTSQEEMAAAIATDRLAKYISEISAVVATSVRPTTGPRRTIYLQFELAPGRAPEVKTSSEPPGAVPDSAHRELVGLRAPDVRGPIAFQLVVQAGADG
jgi:hypothetical protein